MKTDYLEAILNATVYDIAVETPLDLAPGLSARLGRRVLLKTPTHGATASSESDEGAWRGARHGARHPACFRAEGVRLLWEVGAAVGGAGQAAGLSRPLGAAELVETCVREVEHVLRALRPL